MYEMCNYKETLREIRKKAEGVIVRLFRYTKRGYEEGRNRGSRLGGGHKMHADYPETTGVLHKLFGFYATV